MHHRRNTVFALRARLVRAIGDAARTAERSRREVEQAWLALDLAAQRPPSGRGLGRQDDPAGRTRSGMAPPP